MSIARQGPRKGGQTTSHLTMEPERDLTRAEVILRYLQSTPSRTWCVRVLQSVRWIANDLLTPDIIGHKSFEPRQTKYSVLSMVLNFTCLFFCMHALFVLPPNSHGFLVPHMSSTRSSRNAIASVEIISHLSARERLLVAQAVYEYGANAWPDISKVLSKHPLISRPKGFFSPQVHLPLQRQS